MRLFMVSLLFLLLMGVMAAILLSSISPTHELYDYTDMSSQPPTLRAGGHIDVNWQGYPDSALYRYTKPAYATEDMKLSVLLVPEAAFQRGLCGKYTQAQILDEVRTTNRTGASHYQRSVQVPYDMQSGVYELVRQVSSPVRASCFSNSISLTSSPLPGLFLASLLH
jgi:hypothetical protein